MLFWLLISAQTFAATLTVGASGADYTTIQDAIDNSVAGDVISVETGTYAESLIFDHKELTVLGNQSTLAPLSSDHAMRLQNDASATIEDFIILPNGGRAFSSTDSDVVINNCTVNGSGAPNLNGGTLFVDGGTGDLNNVTIDNNSLDYGVAAFTPQTLPHLDWTTFRSPPVEPTMVERSISINKHN